MPVTDRSSSGISVYQRAQYARGGLGRMYWDYRDRVAMSILAPSDRRIVDLGCGEGITLEKLCRFNPGGKVEGIDALAENVSICGRHGLPARLGRAEEIPCESDSVDAVFFMEVIEHLQRPERALREILRILRPGGKAAVVFPNDPVFKIARLMALRCRDAFYDPGHFRQWTPADIRKALRENGFHRITVRCLPCRLWAFSLHAVVFARKPLPGGGKG